MTLTVESRSQTNLLNFHRVVGEDRTLLTDQLFKLTRPKHHGTFPGSMCVSLEREHIGLIRSKPYWVCEKTDGFRFLMLVTRLRGMKLIVLVGRNMTQDVYCIGMKNVPRKLYDGAVLDGEIVTRKETGQMCFLVFDCFASNGVNVSHKPFSDRITTFAQDWKDYKADSTDPVTILDKKFFEVRDFGDFLAHMEAAATQFPLDGIIFTPDELPMIQGRHYKLFKWKRPCDHTIDFLLRVDTGVLFIQDASSPGRALVEGGRLVAPPHEPVPEGAICECQCIDPGQGLWRYVKMRTDKTYPNDAVTLNRTLKNIVENLDLPELVSAFAENI